MYCAFFFKIVVPAVLLYYLAIQFYLVYYLYTAEAKIRFPSTPTIEPTEHRKKLVENVLAIYQCRATPESFGTYTCDVECEDHSAYFKGLETLKNFAYLARKMKAQFHSLKEHHFEDQIILELNQTYTCWFGCKVNAFLSVVYLELEGEGRDEKVKTFRDEWMGKHLITPENTPFAFTGVSARFFRQIHARLFNIFTYAPPKDQS